MARTPEPIVWLSLVDVSGPFLAGTVLEDAFPQGLDKIETPRRQRLRAAYDEWLDAVDEDDSRLVDLHQAWVEMVLRDGLEYDDEVLATKEQFTDSIIYRSPEHGVEFSPDFAIRNGDGVPKLLITIYPPGTILDKPLPEGRWPASPAERMTLVCRANSCRIGLVTNGEQWMLVNAPVGETSGYASWYARLWWQEPVTLKAFQSLLGVRRCFGPEEDTLPKLLERSLDFQEEVTNTLGEQVRRAVEVLIQSLGRADQDRNGELLKDVPPVELYEAGLTVMMRLVFILCAEERGLLLLGDPVYDQHYAVSTLRSQLREDADQYGVEVLERRHDAWSRLLSVFRVIYGGVEHEALRLPALGGSLFDPDRFPFLEGRAPGTIWREQPAIPLPIDNRTVLLLMTALQVLEQRGGAQLLSYRALDVEQIGHVYEGLLEYTAARIPEITLGLIGTKKLPNPQMTLVDLESLSAKGEKSLLNHLNEVTGRSLSALRKSVNGEEKAESLVKLIQACHGDESLARRVLPYSELIRSDSWGSLLVYPKGSFAIVKGTDRRSSGTHYTPRSLTEPIVRYTLEPLVYEGPAEGLAQEDWKLKSSADILALNVCDMACGSGAFLVEACRYLSQRLVETWGNEEVGTLTVGIDGMAHDSSEVYEPLPKNLDDRLLIARRLVAQSCLYGVDVNHLAVELAKLSIWLVTLAKNKPFSFLDHALRCGDSLIGLHDLKQLTTFSLDMKGRQMTFDEQPIGGIVNEAIALRIELESMTANTVEDVHRQEALKAEADEKIARLKYAADLLVAAEFWCENARDKEDRLDHAAIMAGQYIKHESLTDFELAASKERRGQKVFHWPLEFPEVIVKRDGFDAFVGNPPFMGGRKISSNHGAEYERYLKSHLIEGTKGTLDLVLFFLIRSSLTLRTNGTCGFIATDSIRESDNRDVGLPFLFLNVTPFRSIPSQPWPGVAGVRISMLHFAKGQWSGTKCVDDVAVDQISANLEAALLLDTPFPLAANAGFCSDGVKVQGIGFVVDDDEAHALLATQKRNSEILTRYIVGDDINTHPQHLSKRWVINFWNRPEDECNQYELLWAILLERVKPYRDGLTRQVHEHCFWKFWDRREDFFNRVRLKKTVLVCSKLSKYLGVCKGDPSHVFSEKAKVFDFSTDTAFATLQSTLHMVWALEWGSSTGETPAYVGTKCFNTLPFPSCFYKNDETRSLDSNIEIPLLRDIGAAYYAYRQDVMKERSEGLTKTYNRLHGPGEASIDIQKMRDLHTEMDQAVAITYGWTDLDLGHGFHETKQGIRFTISESARREVLQRLLKLNHERYKEEVKQGLHTKGSRKSTGRRKTRKNDMQSGFFDGQ